MDDDDDNKLFSMADMGFEDAIPEGDEDNGAEDNDNNNDNVNDNDNGENTQPSTAASTDPLVALVTPSATSTALGDSKDASRAATASSSGSTPRQHTAVTFSEELEPDEQAAFRAPRTPGTYDPTTGELVILTDEELELQRIADQELLEREAEEARVKAEERARYVAEHCTTLKFRYIEPIGKGSLAHFLGTRDREVILEDRMLQSYADLQVEIAKLHPNSKHLFVCQYADGSLLTSDNFIPVNAYSVREAPLSTAALNRLQATFEYARLPTMWELETYTGWPKKKEEEEEVEPPKSEMDNILGDLLGRVRWPVVGRAPPSDSPTHVRLFFPPRRCPKKPYGKRWRRPRRTPTATHHWPPSPTRESRRRRAKSTLTKKTPPR